MEADPLVGQIVAERYMVLSQLGSGGFGSVYMAKHTKLNNPVALKVLHSHYISNTQVVQRFEREAEATSRLNHNAIAGVHDIGLLPDGRPFMVMEYLQGLSLADLIEQEGALPYERVTPLFVECCDALRYAHKQGLLHRDIKPDNIFVVRDIDGVEHAKLLDFGLAKLVFGEDMSIVSGLTESGVALGTPWYMSPEQCQAKPLDGRTDIYSLGFSLYEALAGRRPFSGRTHYEAMSAHLHSRVPPLNDPNKDPIVPKALEDAILRSLAKGPNDRFTTAEEFRDALAATVPGGAYLSRTPAQAPSQLRAETLSPAMTTSTKQKSGQKSGQKSTQKKAAAQKTAILSSIAAVAVIALIAGGAVWYQSGLNTKKTSVPETTPQPAETAEPVASQADVKKMIDEAVQKAKMETIQQQQQLQRRQQELQQEQQPRAAKPVQPCAVPSPQTAVKPAAPSQPAQPQAVPVAQPQQQPITMQTPIAGPDASPSPFPELAPLKATRYLPDPTPSSSPTASTSSGGGAERQPPFEIPPGYQWAQPGEGGIPADWRPGMPLPPGVLPPLPPNWRPGTNLPPMPPAMPQHGGRPGAGGN